MGKYKLSQLLTEVAGGRIGTLNISARELVDKMEELENRGDVLVKRLEGPSADGKTNIEFEVHPDGKYNPDKSFSVYDYRFGFDPMDPDHVDETYPFSVGGRGDAFEFAEKLVGAERMGYSEAEEKKELPQSIKDKEKIDAEIEAKKAKGMMEEEKEMSSDEVIKIIKMMNPEAKEKFLKKIAKMGQKMNEDEEGIGQLYVQPAVQKEIRFHIEAFRKGDIEVDDMIQAIEDIIFGRVPAPGMREDLQREDKSPKDLLKKIEKDIRARLGEKYSNMEIQLFLDSLERDISRGDFDGVEQMYDNGDHYMDFEDYIIDKRTLEEKMMKEKFKRYMK